MKGLFEFNYYMPTKVIFGLDKINMVGEEAAKLGSKALIVTGKTAAKNFGYDKKIMDLLKKNNVDSVLFDKIESNPDRMTVNDGAKIANDENCDLVIGLGGGGAMDSAKGIALVAVNNEDVWNYVEGKDPEKEGLPVLSIPTTAGTGSEVTPWAVVSNKSKKLKVGYGGPYNFSTVSILDPGLTISMDHNLTVTTGIDALAHALEAYISAEANVVSDIYAMEAIKIIVKNIRDAASDGKNMTARSNMLYGNMLAGMALAVGDLTAGHIIGESIGAIYDNHHGLVIGLLLPAVMEYNYTADLEKNAKLAEAMGEDISGLSLEEAARKAPTAMKKLLKDIGFPSGLKEIGVELDDSLLDLCMKSEELGINPVEIDRNGVKEIIENSL